MLIVFEQVLQLLLFGAAGFCLCRCKKVSSSHTKILSALEFYVFLPANIFKTFSARFTPAYLSEKYSFVLVSLALLLLLFCLARFPARRLTGDAYQRRVLQYSFIIANYGYIGYPLTAGIFGEEMLLNVMMFALPLTFFTPTVGYCMLTNNPVSPKKLLNPVVFAVAAGMAVGLCGLPLPAPVTDAAASASACMAPVSMLLTGMVIAEYPIRDLLRNRTVYVVCLLRLLLIPCGAALLIRSLALHAMLVPVLMITAMPVGMNTVIYPRLVGEDCSLGAAMVFVSTLLSCLTVPLCLLLFGISP